MRKSTREIETLQRGFQGTGQAMFETFVNTKIGDNEFDLYRGLANNILLSGADSVAFNHINAGPQTGFPHASPTEYQVKKGDIIKADSGGYYDNYYSNVGRTGRIGKPTQKELDLWKRLREIHHEVASMLKPGNNGRQLFKHADILHKKHGIPFPFAHNGHSIGLEVHEHPMISPNDETPYEAGMVSTVETRVRWVGKAGYHIEDLYLITDGAPILLSNKFGRSSAFLSDRTSSTLLFQKFMLLISWGMTPPERSKIIGVPQAKASEVRPAPGLPNKQEALCNK